MHRVGVKGREVTLTHTHMAAPPGQGWSLAPVVPATTEKKDGTKTLRFKPGEQHWRAFEIKFVAKLGANLRTVLKAGLMAEFDHLNLDMRTILLREHIHDALIETMDENDDLILEMNDACGSDGVLEFMYLKAKYDKSSTASTVITLIGILNATIGYDVAAGARKIIADNNSLKKEMQLPDRIVACLIIAKLPAAFGTLRDIIIEKDELPDPKELLVKIENRQRIVNPEDYDSPTPTALLAAAGTPDNKSCLNCGGDHLSSNCPNKCSVCKTSYCGVFLPGSAKLDECPTIRSDFPARIYNAGRKTIPLRMYEVLKKQWESNKADKDNQAKTMMAKAENDFNDSYNSIWQSHA
jgi:hypothetical protein